MGSVIPKMSISWKESRPKKFAPTLPVMATTGMESMYAVAMPVTRLVAPGPLVRDDDARLSRDARPTVRGVRRALLVRGDDVLDVPVAVERVVNIEHRAAGIAEHRLDALLFQAFDEDLSTVFLHKSPFERIAFSR